MLEASEAKITEAPTEVEGLSNEARKRLAALRQEPGRAPTPVINGAHAGRCTREEAAKLTALFYRGVVKTALKITAVLFLSSIISGGPCWASENERCGDPCGKPTAWEEFNAYELKMAVPGKPAYQSWRGKFDTESGDIQIELETSDGSKTIKGRILLFGGRVMAIQGPIVKAGYEIDALDSVVLQSRLVARLLGEVFPKRPNSSQWAARDRLQESENRNPICYAQRTRVHCTPMAGHRHRQSSRAG